MRPCRGLRLAFGPVREGVAGEGEPEDVPCLGQVAGLLLFVTPDSGPYAGRGLRGVQRQEAGPPSADAARLTKK
jgi:hypothetical protein